MPDDQEIAPDVYRTPGGHHWVYPIDYDQVKGLVSKTLTLIEATGMNSSQMKAVKSLMNQAVYGWFEQAQENARTAAPQSGLRPMRVVAEGVFDRPSEGRKEHFYWTQNGHDAITLKRTRPGDDTRHPWAEIRWVDGEVGEKLIQVRWVGSVSWSSEKSECDPPSTDEMAIVWQALSHALTTAAPHFPDQEHKVEVDVSEFLADLTAQPE